MANKSTKFALRFRARTFIVLASLFVLAISTLLPIGQALAVPTTNTPSNSTTTSTTSSSAVNSVNPTNSTNTSTTVTTVPDNPDEMQTCDQAAGPLSFFLCPVYAMMMKGINWLAGPEDSILTQMLHVPPLQFSKDSGLMRAYGNILAFVNGLFILVFLVIIVLSLIKDFTFLENYHLKQTLPRLVAAIIIAQFGYLLCGILIDIGNILGTLIPNTIAAGVLGSGAKLPGLADSVVGLLAFGNPQAVGQATATVTNTLFGAGTGVVFILLFLMAAAVLFSLLLAFIYMVARYLIITLLVLAAPLAFLAWVLPGTQSFFSKWGKNLLRLVMMYPLVVTVITTAEILAFLLQHPSLDPNIYTDDRLKLLIGGLIPFVALLMIPKLLKLSGDLVEITGGAVAGFVAGKVANKDHVGTASRYGKEGLQNSIAYNDKLNKTRFGRLAVAGVSGLSANSAVATAKMGQTRDRAQAVYDKAAKYGTSDELKAMMKQNYRPAKIAGLAALADKGDRDAVKEALANGLITKDILEAATTKDFGAFKSMPDLRNYFDSPAKQAAAFSSMTSKSFGDVSGGTIKDWLGTEVKNPTTGVKEFVLDTSKLSKFTPQQYTSLFNDKSNRSGIPADVLRKLAEYGHNAPADPHNIVIQQTIANGINADGTWVNQ